MKTTVYFSAMHYLIKELVSIVTQERDIWLAENVYLIEDIDNENIVISFNIHQSQMVAILTLSYYPKASS